MTFQELLAFAERHPYLSLALVGLTIAIVYTEVARLFRGYKALRPAELTGLINRENALVIDLSASNDFEKGHIAGSKSVQPSQFDPENKLLANAKDAAGGGGVPQRPGLGRCRQAPEEGRLHQGLLARRRHRRLAAGRPAAGQGSRLMRHAVRDRRLDRRRRAPTPA